MKARDLLNGIRGPTAYYAELAVVLGGIYEAIFLCQLLYWVGKQHDSDGWIYKTQVEIQHETALTKYEQRQARSTLVEKGVLEERHAGVPAKMYFRIDIERLVALWEAHRSVVHGVDNKIPTVRTTSEPRRRDQAGRYVDNQQSTERPTLIRSKEYTMSTPEITAVEDARNGAPAPCTLPEKKSSSASTQKQHKFEWGSLVHRDHPVYQAMMKAAHVTAASTDKKKRELEEACAARLQEGATVEQIETFVRNWWQHKYGPAYFGKAPTAQNLRDDWEAVLELEQRLAARTSTPRAPRETEADLKLKDIFGLRGHNQSNGGGGHQGETALEVNHAPKS